VSSAGAPGSSPTVREGVNASVERMRPPSRSGYRPEPTLAASAVGENLQARPSPVKDVMFIDPDYKMFRCSVGA